MTPLPNTRTPSPWWCSAEGKTVEPSHHLHLAPCCGCGSSGHPLCCCPDTPEGQRSFSFVHPGEKYCPVSAAGIRLFTDGH